MVTTYLLYHGRCGSENGGVLGGDWTAPEGGSKAGAKPCLGLKAAFGLITFDDLGLCNVRKKIKPVLR